MKVKERDRQFQIECYVENRLYVDFLIIYVNNIGIIYRLRKVNIELVL